VLVRGGILTEAGSLWRKNVITFKKKVIFYTPL
jgi:hypothetical protein